MEATELHDIDFLSLSFGSMAEQTKPSITSNTYGGPSDFGSDPGSPFSGSYPTEENEQEKEEDEYVAELTRRMANYMLQDDEQHEKAWGGSGSPQSTLWSPFGSGYVSPIGPSREPSPPLTPAMEKFEKMKIKDEFNPVLIASMNSPNPQIQSKQALIDDQIRSVQANFHKIKRDREREKRERREQNDGVFGYRARATAKQYGNYQRPGSGMRAVFLNGSCSRPGSTGTGVFLPRGSGTVMESRKKTGCSTVIIPARVVQALKLHFDKLGAPSRLNFDFPPHHDALLIAMNNKNSSSSSSSSPAYSEEKEPLRPAVAVKSLEEPPADLPQEWTY